ncbi:MAG: four helix bundle protein [Fluviicola sp.]|nr:MAG: four helix bundle protein [Fluviicola sp.]
MREYGFEKLLVWQEAKDFAVLIYRITQSFLDEEKYGLTNQIRRATISVSSNIAEGANRTTKNDQARFYSIAYSSLMEVLSQTIISAELSFMTIENKDKIRIKIESISNKLNALKNATTKR